MSELPYEGDEPYVYVSYAREDEDKCLSFIKHLDSLGYRVYYNDDIDVDQAKITAAASVVFFVTAESSLSEELKQELQFASSSAKDGVAVHLEECEVDGTVGLLLGQFDELKRYRMKEAFYRKRLKKSLDERTVRDGVTLPAVVEIEFEAPTPKPLPKISAPPKAAAPEPVEDELASHLADFTASHDGPAKPKASPAPAKKAGASVGSSVPIADEITKTVQEKVEEFKKLEGPQKALYGGGAALALFIVVGLIYLAFASPDGADPNTAGGGGSSTGAVVEEGPALTPEQREKQRKALAAELEKRSIEREQIRAERERDEQVQVALGKGRRFLREGKYAEAVTELSAALKLDAGNTDALLARAEAYYKNRQDPQAVADYTKVIEADAGNLEALVGRGQVLRFKEPKKAIADFTAALKLDSKNVEVWVARGDAKRQVKTSAYLKSAIKDYSYSIKLDPTHAAYYGRSLCYKKLGDVKRAHRDTEKARTLKP